MKKILVALLITLLSVSMCFAAGSACTSISEKKGNLTFIHWAWTSDDATGAVTCSGKGAPTNQSGMILGVKFTPAAAGTVPSDAYDVVINNAGGADVLMGVGANLTNDDSVTTQWKNPENTNGGPVILYNETLAPVVTNAGNSKTGTITMALY